MDKTAIFENQIRSLNEIVQILERQLASQINSHPEEILTQWRKKVYELLVKNTFLTKQNKEIISLAERTREERDLSLKKSRTEMSQKDEQIQILKNKLQLVTFEKEELVERNKGFENQKDQFIQEHNNLRTSLQRISNLIRDQYEESFSKMERELTQQISQMSDRAFKLSRTVKDIKRHHWERIERMENENRSYNEILQKVLRGSEQNFQISELSGQQRDIILQINKLYNEKIYLTKNLEEKHSLLNQKDVNIQELEVENQNLNQRVAKLVETIGEGESRLSHLTSQLEKLDSDVKVEASQKQGLEMDISNYQRQLLLYQQEIEGYKFQLAEIQRERDTVKRQKQELESDFERLERNKNQEAEILNSQLYTLETAKNDEIRKLKIDQQAKLIEQEKKKEEALRSLRLDLDNLMRIKDQQAEDIDELEKSIENLQEKNVSLSNHVNDLLKIIERKDKTLEKYKNQQQAPSEINQTAKSHYFRGSTVSKKANSQALQTPQTKIIKRAEVDENFSPAVTDQGWSQMLKSEKRGLAGETGLKNTSKMSSKIDAVEKMALNMLDDDDF